ncbi:MAG: phosphonoacetaldehyde reductase [Firmicutes bacterium]|nr:phosphonoacetaldehyde reductase [Bacillota bacterium]
MATYANPVQLYFGTDALSSLTELVRSSGHQRLLLLTGAHSLKASGYLAKIQALLAPTDVLLQDQVPANPDVADLFCIKQATDSFAYDAIVAVGGGSVIDTAKALAAFKGHTPQSIADVRAIIQSKAYLPLTAPVCPIWAIPTTAGTGSEVTPWATIWDREESEKYSIAAATLFPRIAIVDPALTLNLSPTMTASSALDALSHALEAYWSKNTNEIVRLYALKAITLIVTHLAQLLDHPADLTLRAHIASGSLFAGLAFSNTKTTSCHSISYPLTLQFGINHGVAVSLTLGQMLVKNEPALLQKEELFSALGIAQPAELITWIRAILAQAKIATRLSEYGVSQDDLAIIAAKSFTPGRMDNNPIDVDKPFLLELLASIF